MPFGDLISLSGGTAGINIDKLALIRVGYCCNSIQIEVYNIDIDMANDTVTTMYGTYSILYIYTLGIHNPIQRKAFTGKGINADYGRILRIYLNGRNVIYTVTAQTG
ncbi:hypothetical protein D3C80_1749040 [compost metagenome]